MDAPFTFTASASGRRRSPPQAAQGFPSRGSSPSSPARWSPVPRQEGQAPWGEDQEKVRGSGSSAATPQRGQARATE